MSQNKLSYQTIGSGENGADTRRSRATNVSIETENKHDFDLNNLGSIEYASLINTMKEQFDW